MKKHQAKEFIENNTEALRLLSRKMKELDTVRNCPNEIELRGRQRAIEIIESWLTDVWGYSQEIPLPSFEEEDLYTRLTSRGKSE